MGVDIDVFARVVEVSHEYYDEVDEDSTDVFFQRDETTKDEEERARLLVGEMDYNEALREVKPWYKCEELKFSFRAGSATGYNEWLNTLAQLAGYPLVGGLDYTTEKYFPYPYYTSAWKAGSGPFRELIMHDDQSGVLESYQCTKLYQDFLTHLPVVETRVDTTLQWSLSDLLGADTERRRIASEQFSNVYFLEQYKKWMEACHIVSQGGCISFH